MVKVLVVEHLSPALPPAAHTVVALHSVLLLKDLIPRIRTRVMWILLFIPPSCHYQNEQLAFIRFLVPLYAQTCECQDTASDHDGRSLEKEMVPQLSHVLQEVASPVEDDELAIHIEQGAHHVAHLLTADPLARADEGGRLVSHPDEGLLDLRVNPPSHFHLRDRRNRTLDVVAVGEEGEECLQGPIRAAPALVLLSLLKVVIIGVVALNDAGAIERSQTKVNGAKWLFGRNRRE